MNVFIYCSITEEPLGAFPIKKHPVMLELVVANAY